MYIGGLNAQGACSLSQHFSPWPKPPGGKLPGLLRKLLNRLRTKVERFKDNLTRWGFIDRSANINPTVACLYRQWAFVKKNPASAESCTFCDLYQARPNAISVAEHWTKIAYVLPSEVQNRMPNKLSSMNCSL